MSSEFLPVSNSRYLNVKLQKATEQCRTYDLNIKNNKYAIAYIVGQVEAEEVYKDDGFNNAAEWVCDAFGVAKTVAYNLISVGREYTRPIRNNKGKIVGFASNIVSKEGEEMPLIDFSVDQISRMRKLGRDKILELYEQGILKPSMTTADMMQVVKGYSAKRVGSSDDKPASETPPQAQETTTQTPEPTTATETQEPVKPAENAPQEAVQPDEAGEVIDTSRSPEYDTISTRYLIAELYMRGFKVFREGREVKIRWHEDIQDWQTETGE